MNNVFVWIGFGLVAGILANILDSRKAQGGFLGAITLGILGALIGGFFATWLFGQSTILSLDIGSLTVAITLALFFLLIHRTVFLKPEE